MYEEKPIERTNPTLSFVDQLTAQINLCREAMSTNEFVCERIQTLENLLWAQLSKDKEYLEAKEKILKEVERASRMWSGEYMSSYSNRLRKSNALFGINLNASIDTFREIMIFIKKKNLMPIGDN